MDSKTGSVKASPRKRIAYHEAGHAVAAYLFRQRFLYVTIKPDDEQGSVGHLRAAHVKTMSKWEYSDGWPEMYRARLERLAMSSLAGVVAEGLMTGRHSWVRASGDTRTAFEMVSPLTYGDVDEAAHYRDWLACRVRRLLSPAHYQRSIKAVAYALLRNETVSYSEVRTIIQKAIPVVSLGVDFNKAVAAAVAFAEAR